MKNGQMEKKRIKEIIGVIQRIASGDFSAKIPISEKQDSIDALASGINILSEEIEANMRGKDDQSEALLNMLEDVNEAKEAAERVKNALKESEEKFRLLFENATEGILFFDTEGNIRDVNPKLLKITGCKREDVVGKHFMDVLAIFNLDPSIVIPIFEKVMSGEPIKNVELDITNKKGKQITIAANPVLIRKNGEVIGASLTVEDLTNRKLAEEALRESEEKYRTLFETSPEAIILLGLDGVLQDCNNAAEKISGMRKEELIGKSFMELSIFDEETLSNLIESFPKAINGEIPSTIELTIQTGKERKWIETFPALLKKNNEVFALQLIVRDITEHKLAEDKLKESEEKYRDVVERANDGIVIVQDGFVKYANPSLLELAGYSKEEIIDTQFINHVHPDEVPKLIDRYKRRMSGEDVEGIYETLLKRKDNSDVYAEINAGVISYLGEPANLVFVRDITERKKAGEKLKQTMNELKRSKTELEQFINIAYHDLQEPLRMVTSYVQLLERRYKGKLDEDADEFIGYAVDGIMHIHRLINDLLNYTLIGGQSKRFERVDCTEVINRAMNNLQAAIEESGAVITFDPLPIIRADDLQLVQLSQNLLSNAIKFRSEEPPRIHVSAEQKKNEWLFSVRDNGIGIDPKYAERIFTIFQRLHSRGKYPGTGIGLAICKKIVEKHGGRIWVESEPGKGATFRFTIPKNRGEQE